MSRDQGASRIQTQDSKSKQCIYLQGNRQNSKRVKTVARAQSHQRLSTHSKKIPILWLIPHKASSPFCVREFSSQNLSIRKRQVRASYTCNKRSGANGVVRTGFSWETWKTFTVFSSMFMFQGNFYWAETSLIKDGQR